MITRYLVTNSRFFSNISNYLRMDKESSNYIMAQITGSDVEKMDSLAFSLLSSKLAACVNIVPNVKSYYLEHGQIQSAQEILLIVKTKMNLLDRLVEFVEKNHHYDTCEVICFKITKGSKKYLSWIEKELN